jgi:WD40 repeat protein
VTLSPDGRFVAAAGSDKYARLWDIAAGQEIARFASGKENVSPSDREDADCVAFSPDGKILAVGFGSAVMLWDVTNIVGSH